MATSGASLRRSFVAASAAWATAIPMAAAVSAASTPTPAAAGFYLFALAVYATGSAVCHQLPDRSFFLWGRQLPVCARCTGIYAAAAVSAVVLAALRVRQRPPPRWIASVTARRRAGVAALAVNALTLVYEWTTGVAPSNAIRASAGFTLGAVVAAFIVYDVD